MQTCRLVLYLCRTQRSAAQPLQNVLAWVDISEIPEAPQLLRLFLLPRQVQIHVPDSPDGH